VRAAAERRVRRLLASTEPISDADVERELLRIQSHTRFPKRLSELFAALDDDPLLIRETLVRPALVERRRSDVPTLRSESDSEFDSSVRAATEAECPEVEQWFATSLDSAPSARYAHTMVWTGAEAIVWGGFGGGNTGGRYDPALDLWTETSTTDAPSSRFGHSAVWTGTEMIVWGGRFGEDWFNTGARYDPALDSWTPIDATGAPAGRERHTAVWTGTTMIVFGGEAGPPCYTPQAGGSEYDPATDSWQALPFLLGNTAPRSDHTAVWTGTEMIVWGGRTSRDIGQCEHQARDDGARYDPLTRTWSLLPPGPSARYRHTAVWTGSEMIVWGGATPSLFLPDPVSAFDDGSRYRPAANTWVPMSTSSMMLGRYDHTAVWSGDEMIVWGGRDPDPVPGLDVGNGRYQPLDDAWQPVTATGQPSLRSQHRGRLVLERDGRLGWEQPHGGRWVLSTAGAR
jgi:N-acetylneuraminic acid mutarotase